MTAPLRQQLGLFVRGLVMIAGMVAAGWLLRESGLASSLDEAWIDRHVRGQGAAGELLFVAAGAAFTAVGLPRQLIAFLGGYAFGVGLGTLLTVAATIAGAIATFTYARLLGRKALTVRLPQRLQRLDTVLGDHPFRMTLLIRLLPVGSNVFTNLAAGVSSVRPLPFLAASAVGYVPQTLVFALAGSGVSVDPLWRNGLAIVLFLASSAIALGLYRRYRRDARVNGIRDTGDDLLDGQG